MCSEAGLGLSHNYLYLRIPHTGIDPLAFHVVLVDTLRDLDLDTDKGNYRVFHIVVLGSHLERPPWSKDQARDGGNIQAKGASPEQVVQQGDEEWALALQMILWVCGRRLVQEVLEVQDPNHAGIHLGPDLAWMVGPCAWGKADLECLVSLNGVGVDT